MVIDTIRRSTLKAMVLATGATLVPGLAAAAYKRGAGTSSIKSTATSTSSTAIRGTGLIVSFGEKPSVSGSRQIIVTNTNDHPVTLTQVYPGIVSTPDGQYDLNSLLVNGSREFAANHATTLTINVADGDHINHHNQLNQRNTPHWQAMQTAKSHIHVRTTNANVNGGRPVTTVRQVLS